VFAVQIADEGFLLSADAVATTTVRIVRVAGLDRALQFFRVRVASRAVLVVSTDRPDEEPLLLASLTPQFPGDAIAIVREERTGWARVTSEGSDDGIAAAVAMVKASCGWDESNPMAIELDARRVNVFLEHRETWFARVA
jgi:hypothetical protein